jgi:hypothetical protein
MRRPRRAALAGCVASAALAGCGEERVSAPEQVVRAWADALTTLDDEAAAAYFADEPIILQGLLPTRPRTREAIVRWHATLECGGTVVGLAVEGGRVTATFALTHRPQVRCPAPGFLSTVVFNVEAGRILTWEQTPPGYVPEY